MYFQAETHFAQLRHDLNADHVRYLEQDTTSKLTKIREGVRQGKLIKAMNSLSLHKFSVALIFPLAKPLSNFTDPRKLSSRLGDQHDMAVPSFQ